jgi:hypothetical protein
MAISPKRPTWPTKGETGSVMSAVSAGIDAAGNTYIVLYWSPNYEVTGYNLYRSLPGGRSSRRPVNGNQPIAPVKTCAELEAIIPPDSPEWDLLTNAFTGLAAAHEFRANPAAHRQDFTVDQSTLVGLHGLRGYPGLASAAIKSLLGKNLVDPCTAMQRGLTSEEESAFDALAHINLKLRLTRGLAYEDHAVQAGQTYTYELRGVKKDRSEVVLAKGVTVVAGVFTLPDPPSGFNVTAGDHQVLTLWNSNPHAVSYSVQRSTNSGAFYQVINDTPIWLDITKDLQNNPIKPPCPGFVDFQRWDSDGLPSTHTVNGVAIAGPDNGTTYYYEVASLDILGRAGSWSAFQAATPACSTSPMAPGELKVDPSTNPPALMLTWRKVTRDVANHQILDSSQTYQIYRSDTQASLEDLATLSTHLVASQWADPTDAATPTLAWTDSDPSLVPPYGEKDFWYRLTCTDAHGNVSAPSAIISGRIPDTRPPGPTLPTGAEGFADHIRVYWEPNPETDLAGYQVWRGVCDRGLIYTPGKEKQGHCDVSLVGDVSFVESKNLFDAVKRIYFDDYSVPSGSPLCYAYWVRAYDASQNLYPGDHNCPASRHEYVCQRLYEQTPPPAPIITGLRARNDAVLVEWIGSPVQDLRAFHIYRSDKENDPPAFVGCMLSDGTPYPGKWPGIQPQCADIPAEPDPAAAKGSFLDTIVEANRIYWYRVSALDWLGNESEAADLTKLPAISTFTYSRDLPDTPVISPPAAPSGAGCGLPVNWSPAYDPAVVEGFVVFRSNAPDGNYRQLSPVVKGNTFTDQSARRGVDYWFKVQAIDLTGKLSAASAPVLHRY